MFPWWSPLKLVVREEWVVQRCGAFPVLAAEMGGLDGGSVTSSAASSSSDWHPASLPFQQLQPVSSSCWRLIKPHLNRYRATVCPLQCSRALKPVVCSSGNQLEKFISVSLLAHQLQTQQLQLPCLTLLSLTEGSWVCVSTTVYMMTYFHSKTLKGWYTYCFSSCHCISECLCGYRIYEVWQLTNFQPLGFRRRNTSYVENMFIWSKTCVL